MTSLSYPPTSCADDWRTLSGEELLLEEELLRREEADLARFVNDPLGFIAYLWPDASPYDRQQEILLSLRDNPETFVVAGHQLGKDWISAAGVLWYYLTRHPVRIVTTSVRDDHLRVLWGEMGRFIQTARPDVPLLRKDGGPLVFNHREIRKYHDGKLCTVSYLIGMVSERGEGMQGHHAPHTLLVVDEASGVDDLTYERATTWAKRIMVVGNPYGNGHWFHRAVKGGDQAAT